jgi:hypothetical protein
MAVARIAGGGMVLAVYGMDSYTPTRGYNYIDSTFGAAENIDAAITKYGYQYKWNDMFEYF